MDCPTGEGSRDRYKGFNKKTGEFYCLQPLVVRKMNHDETIDAKLKNPEEEWYEVIDGQQRLTTIYLILHYIDCKLKGETDDYDIDRFFNIAFARDNGKTINFDDVFSTSDETIDIYHLRQAWECLQCTKPSAYTLATALIKKLSIDEDDDEDEIHRVKDAANDVRFIWYEAVDEDPIKVFTRLNIGKISLTNAELVKALLLNSSNFGDEVDADNLHLRQQEISSRWDEIENKLHDERFWYFLSSEEPSFETRIDFILGLVKEMDLLVLGGKEGEDFGNDSYQTFRYYDRYFKKKARNKSGENKALKKAWNAIDSLFSTFCEWYDDLESYHYIGCLIAIGVTLSDIIGFWDNASSKSAFINNLKVVIYDKVKDLVGKQFTVENKTKARPLLLFHNIQTAINQNAVLSKKYGSQASYRFPFNLYKDEHWDVEHINPTTDNPEDNDKVRTEWLANVWHVVDDSVKKKIAEYFDCQPVAQNKVFEEIKKCVPEPADWTDEEKNKVWNYVLLDQKTNRSYGNAIFSAKRRIIIAKERGMSTSIPKDIKDVARNWKIKQNAGGKNELQEKASENDKQEVAPTSASKPTPPSASSAFVPMVTKYVFLKYYSETKGQDNYWTIPDAQKYLESIKNAVDKIKP